jgi:hypothetical protein
MGTSWAATDHVSLARVFGFAITPSHGSTYIHTVDGAYMIEQSFQLAVPLLMMRATCMSFLEIVCHTYMTPGAFLVISHNRVLVSIHQKLPAFTMSQPTLQ